MWRACAVDRPNCELLAFAAERAGLALACAYSSSSEFEAALIRERRAAGIYGPRRHRRRAMFAAAALIALTALTALLINI